MPTVAIGIHVHADPEQLRATIASVRAHTALPYTLILLPDGASREIQTAAAEFQDLRSLGTEVALGAAACFNRLFRNTEEEVVVLLESGTRPGPGWLAHLLRAFDSNPKCGLAGPSTNLSWNEQGVLNTSTSDPEGIARAAEEASRRFGSAQRTLQPLYSLADFCYAVRRTVFDSIGEADEAYGIGPCWEMDYNIRAARAGFDGLWVGASYVHRASIPTRRLRGEALLFNVNKRRYQDKYCGLRLNGSKTDYRSHCRGDACPNFAPPSLIMPARPVPPPEFTEHATASPTVPLVSCIMPTHNRREFLPRAIECFLRQDYPNLEMLIVDDGSDSIRDLVPAERRIRYYQLPRKLTIGAKRNFACDQASGDIIVHWDDDDWYPPDRVRKQVEALSERGASISGSSRLYYMETTGARAFLYQYEGGSRKWVAGNTLAYRRTFWLGHRFLDIQVAEDSRFIWSAERDSVRDLEDPGLCVASIHGTNASPKCTSGSYWKPCPMEKIRSLMGEAPAVTGAAELPLISCIMPTFDRRTFIPLALECFRSQTYSPKELVVVDDGSDPVADLLQGIPGVNYLRLPRRLSIGAKRNLACQQSKGEIIAHWDDDDWYAPNRLELQMAPVLAATADITGLTNRFVLQMPGGQFWTTTEGLHRRMFVGDVHGGTLLFRKAILNESIRYPEINLAEDAVLIQQALRRRKRLVRMENQGSFIYMRHGANAWKFSAGQFLDPSGWNPTTAPPGFSARLLELYRLAVETASGESPPAAGKLSSGAGLT